MIKDYEVVVLMKRNFCTYFEIDRNHKECKDCRQLYSCKAMETTVRDILAKKEKHDKKFIEKFKEKIFGGGKCS